MIWTVELVSRDGREPLTLPRSLVRRPGAVPLINGDAAAPIVDVLWQRVGLVPVERVGDVAEHTRFAPYHQYERFYLVAESKERRFAGYLRGDDPPLQVASAHGMPLIQPRWTTSERTVDPRLVVEIRRTRYVGFRRPPFTDEEALIAGQARGIPTADPSEVRSLSGTRTGRWSANQRRDVPRGSSLRTRVPVASADPEEDGYTPEWARPLDRR